MNTLKATSEDVYSYSLRNIPCYIHLKEYRYNNHIEITWECLDAKGLKSHYLQNSLTAEDEKDIDIFLMKKFKPNSFNL
jgi:hypothetical protein